MTSSKAQPLISIVIATFNGAKYITPQLQSVINQTYKNLEIIIVDDCSTDNTVPILKEFAAIDDRIRIYQNEENRGYIKNFEKGMLLSTGEFLMPCDQDDIWNKTKIEILLHNIDDNILIYCDSLMIDESGVSLNKKLSDIKNLQSFNDCLVFVIGNSVSGHASLFKRELLYKTIPFPDFFTYDWWIAFCALLYGKIKFIDFPLVYYRQHSHSTIGAIKTKGKQKNRVNYLQQLEILRKRMKLFYDYCPNHLHQKKILSALSKSYENFSLINNWNRVMLFLKYRNQLLATKKRSTFRKILFCLKMFFKII